MDIPPNLTQGQERESFDGNKSKPGKKRKQSKNPPQQVALSVGLSLIIVNLFFICLPADLPQLGITAACMDKKIVYRVFTAFFLGIFTPQQSPRTGGGAFLERASLR